MRRFLLTSVLAALVLVGASGMASAQQYPPSGPTITLSSQRVAGGGTLTVSGTGWQAGALITVTIQSSQSVTVRAGADGTFSANFEIPCSVGAGQHAVIASGTARDGQQHSVSAMLTVGACGVPIRALATTGSNSATLYVGVGVALVLLGAALTVAFARRRKEMLGT